MRTRGLSYGLLPAGLASDGRSHRIHRREHLTHRPPSKMLLLGSVTTLSSSIFKVTRPVRLESIWALNEASRLHLIDSHTVLQDGTQAGTDVSLSVLRLAIFSFGLKQTLVAPSHPQRVPPLQRYGYFPSLSTILSITISIVCFRFLFRLNSSCSSTLTISPSV